jgi:hypothetical protein
MAQVSETELLDVQKRLLVAKSEIYRQTVAVELHRLESATAWVPPTLSALQIAYPAVLLAVPLAAWWLGRKRTPLADVAEQIVAGLSTARKLQALWTELRNPDASARS